MNQELYEWKCSDCKFQSENKYTDAESAIRDALKTHASHRGYVYINHIENGYVGRVDGLLFNLPKVFSVVA